MLSLCQGFSPFPLVIVVVISKYLVVGLTRSIEFVLQWLLYRPLATNGNENEQ